jgi:hypothetical protein
MPLATSCKINLWREIKRFQNQQRQLKNYMVVNIDASAQSKLTEQEVTIDLARSCTLQRKRTPVIKPAIMELVQR